MSSKKPVECIDGRIIGVKVDFGIKEVTIRIDAPEVIMLPINGKCELRFKE